jgi:predicted nuclease of predicted toxin-antitoxin system
MFKLYSNENFRQNLVEELRNFGYDVLTSRDAGQANKGIPDDELLQYAVKLNRCVITYNRKDFKKIHKETHCHKGHKGIILCKENFDDKTYAKIIHSHLMEYNILDNQLISIKINNQLENSVVQSIVSM